VAAFLFAASAVAVLVAASLLFPKLPFQWLWQFNPPAETVFRTLGRTAGFALLLLAGGTLAVGAGLLRRKRWAWWFAVILFLVNGCGDLVGGFVTGDWLRSASGALICAGFLYSLFRL
jgi:hypothetical protein